MIPCPKTYENEIIIKKIRQEKETTHLCAKHDESFRLEVDIPRSVGAVEVKLKDERNEYRGVWISCEKGFDKYAIFFSNFINTIEHHVTFSLLIYDGAKYKYPKTGTHRLMFSDSHFLLTDKESCAHKFIFTFESESPSFEISGGIYHIFVDRFKKISPKIREDSKYNVDFENGIPEYAKKSGDFLENNTHFGGNFKGIISELDYISSLEIEAIYLSPVNKAFSNHKYDVGSYYEIDENFGGKDDFISLTKACHERGIKVILDSVFNHTGDNSLYFNKFGTWNSVGAYQSKDSPYYHWYSFKNHPHEYDSWWGIKCLPSIKKGCRDFIEYICHENGVIDFLYSLGADGLRLDVADELTLDFIKSIKKATKRNKPDSIVIGEVWENAARKCAWDEEKYYFDEGKLDSVTNYPLMRGILEYVKNKDLTGLLNTVSEIYTDYTKNASLRLLNIISTHDTFRAITYLSAKEPLTKDEKAHYRMPRDLYDKGIVKMKIASLLQFFLPGVPCIYYGDEIGMEGFEDPFNRMPMKWHEKNEELLVWYKKLMSIRKNNRPLHKGGIEIIYAEDACFIFDRVFENERIRTITNLSDKNVKLNVTGKELLRDKYINEKILLKPCECAVLRLGS